MKTICLLRSVAVLAFITLTTAAMAQRETFEASTVRIIEAKEIKAKFTYKLTVKGTLKIIERRGVDSHGKVIVIFATEHFMTFDDVFFKFDSTELRNKSSHNQLDQMVEALKSKELSGRRFLIEGHTCDLGDDDYNLKLSARRADAIKEYLVKHGIAPERLAVLGCGEKEPAVKLDPKGSAKEVEAQRARNRRVVLRELPDADATPDRNK